MLAGLQNMLLRDGEPELRPVTESSKAETAAPLLGEGLRGKRDQADRCAKNL
jgi:hypothetical protein